MNVVADSFYYQSGECHHRFPAELEVPGFPYPFLQTGTAECAGYPSDYYTKWCFYFDSNDVAHSIWPTTQYHGDGSWHSYAFNSPDNTANYHCYFDGVDQGSITIDAAAWFGPSMGAIGEVNPGNQQLQSDYFAGNDFQPAVQYRDVSGNWNNVPSETYYYAGNPCPFNWGVYVPGSENVGPGSGYSCPTGQAW